MTVKGEENNRVQECTSSICPHYSTANGGRSVEV